MCLWCPQRPEEGDGCPQTGITVSCDSPFWELILGFPEEQLVQSSLYFFLLPVSLLVTGLRVVLRITVRKACSNKSRADFSHILVYFSSYTIDGAAHLPIGLATVVGVCFLSPIGLPRPCVTLNYGDSLVSNTE